MHLLNLLLALTSLHPVQMTWIKKHFPTFWESDSCKKHFDELDVGAEPVMYGIYADEFNPQSANYFFAEAPGPSRSGRRMHYGDAITPYNWNSSYPLKFICNIMEKSDKYQWCTCIIMDDEWVMTNRNCFRNRAHNADPRKDIPPIKITFGSTKRSTHPVSRGVREVHFHPNKYVDAALLRLDERVPSTGHLNHFPPLMWLKTTGYRNYIPPCSTFTCGYVRLTFLVEMQNLKQNLKKRT